MVNINKLITGSLTLKEPGYSVTVAKDAEWYILDAGETEEAGSSSHDMGIESTSIDGTVEWNYHIVPGFRKGGLKGIVISGSAANGLSDVTVNGVTHYSTGEAIHSDYVIYKNDEMTENLVISGYHVYSCLLEGTKVLLANGTTKNIEDVTYNDNLLSWNFDDGVAESVNPIIIKEPGILGNWYGRATTESGKILNTVGGHRVFSVTKGKFKYASDCVGDTILCQDGTLDKIVSFEQISVDKDNMPKFYNVITNRNINLYANGMLTSCSLNNMYPFDTTTMKFIKEDKVLKSYSDFSDIMDEDKFNGLRIAEQNLDTPSLRLYCKRNLSHALAR